MDICVSWMVSGPDLMGSDPNEQMMLTFTSSIIITSLLLLQDTICCYFKTSLSMSNTRLWLLSSGSFKLFSNPTFYLSTQRQTSLISSNQEENFLSSVPSYCQSQSVLQYDAKIIYWNGGQAVWPTERWLDSAFMHYPRWLDSVLALG